MSDPKAICAECRHVLCDGGGYWDYRCGAVKAEKTRDPVTGETTYRFANDLGGHYHGKEPHPNCRGMNDGNCPLFEPCRTLRRSAK